MTTSQSYSSDVFPPIPVLDIWISFPEKDEWHGPFAAIVDSGADFTIVPIHLIRLIDPPAVRPAILSSHWRDQRNTYVYEIDIRIGGGTLPIIDVAGDPIGEQILLGRNVLNLLDLRLDGPGLFTHLLE